jgi:hypothetical protein
VLACRVRPAFGGRVIGEVSFPELVRVYFPLSNLYSKY